MLVSRLRQLTDHLLRDGVVAAPAEAVWGLSCNPFSATAVAEVLALKQRPVDKGLIVVAADESQLEPLLAHLGGTDRAELSLSWPGPNTWLVPNNDVFPEWVTGDSTEVAVRVTRAPALVALCRAFGGPLVSTSANRAGAQPARFAFQVARSFGPGLPRATGSVDLNARPSVIRRLGSGEVLRQ